MDIAIKQIGHLERMTLGERIYLELRDLLMSGKLLPNEKLSLRTVAEALGVSMMPVREAMTRLVAEGALHVLPNRAVSVPLMTQSKLIELMNVRVEIEGYAAEQAALHRTKRDTELIRRLDEQFRQAVKGSEPDVVNALRINKELHFAIYAASGSSILMSIIEGLWLKVGPVINLDLRASQRLATGGAEKHHARMVKAIMNQQGPAARKALAADIKSSSEFIIATGKLPN
jgi:DNA-binding GntR family transcriptional regulator